MNHAKILSKSWQDRDIVGSWEDISGIVARSWQDCDKIVENHGKVLWKSSQDHGNILGYHGAILNRL